MTAKKKVIIVGGGTAGITIANYLQEYFDVVVIEKSEYKKYPIIFKIPLMIGIIFRDIKTKYISKREFVLADGRHIPFYESNVLGGASVINGAVHTLGNKKQWNSILKNFAAMEAKYPESIPPLKQKAMGTSDLILNFKLFIKS